MYPKKFYHSVTYEGILMKLGKLVDTKTCMLYMYVMYDCSRRILNNTRNMVSIGTAPSLIRPIF